MKAARVFVAVLIVAGVVALAPADARADTWYGWQTLVSDGVTAGATLVTAKATSNGTPVAIVAITGYVVSPVVIHLAHEQGLRALGSGGLRLVLPIACGVAGAYISGNKDDRTGLSALPGFIIGLAVGVVAASTLDAAVLAFDDRGDATPSSGSSASPLKTLMIGGTF